MYVRDLEEREYILQATSVNDKELNGNQSIFIRILPTKVNEQFINDISEMWEVVDHDEVTHKIVYFKKQGEGNSLTVEIRGVPKIFDDLDTSRIYERYDQHMTANACFNLIFNGTGYHYVLVDSFEAVQWEGLGDGETRLESFKRALERYKCEFEIRGNTVYLKKLIGRDTSFQYRYRLNASNIIQENDATQYWTYARGYGDYGDGEGGEDWQNHKLFREYTSPLANIPTIGIREAPPIKNGNITDGDHLYNQLKKLVDESLKISVSATIHDLRKQGYALAQPELGDRVFLIDERIGLNDEVRVSFISITRDWRGNVIDLHLTLGSPGLVKRHQSNLKTAMDNINGIMEGKVQLSYNVLPRAIKAATEALTRMNTQLTISEDGSLLAISKDNPNHIVIYNSAGLGVSIDGGRTFEDAITYLGVNTKLLTAGDIHTNNIRIIGDSNYFYWDGTGLHAIDPTDINKFVRLRSDGLYISRGALTIERNDGYRVVNDGYLDIDYGIQSHYPYYMSPDARQEGIWLTTTSYDYKAVGYFNFKHAARYLKIVIYTRVDDPVYTSAVRVEDANNLGHYLGYGGTNDTSEAGQQQTITIDLGVPTGQRRSFYLQLRSTVGGGNHKARVRILQMYLEG